MSRLGYWLNAELIRLFVILCNACIHQSHSSENNTKKGTRHVHMQGVATKLRNNFVQRKSCRSFLTPQPTRRSRPHYLHIYNTTPYNTRSARPPGCTAVHESRTGSRKHFSFRMPSAAEKKGEGSYAVCCYYLAPSLASECAARQSRIWPGECVGCRVNSQNVRPRRSMIWPGEYSRRSGCDGGGFVLG